MPLGEGGPMNEGEKEGQMQAWPVDQTLQHSLGGATQLTRYAISMYSKTKQKVELDRFWASANRFTICSLC